MALTQRLEFRQSQSLVMTPQLMQAIKLLQLSNLDLSTFVEDELERNPLLERANDSPKSPLRAKRGRNAPSFPMLTIPAMAILAATRPAWAAELARVPNPVRRNG